MTHSEMTISDLDWFKDAFVTSYFHVYEHVHFFIGDSFVSSDPKDDVFKKAWLENTAVEQFHAYAIAGTKRHHALILKLNNAPVGAALYRTAPPPAGGRGDTIYLGQFFVHPHYQRRGLGTWVLGCWLRRTHPRSRRLELVARHQNEAAHRLYFKRMGMSRGEPAMTQRYGYDPRSYFSAYLEWGDDSLPPADGPAGSLGLAPLAAAAAGADEMGA